MYIFILLIIWISLIGYSFFVYEKFNIKFELTIPLVFSAITLIMFLGGLLNILNITNILLILIGLVYFIKYIVNKKNKRYDLKNINMFIIICLFLYITIIFQNTHLIHYDNFSHWAVIVKNMLLNNSYPNFLNGAIEFKAYQPGTATFIYFFCNFVKSSEGMMIIAQNYLIIGFLSSLFAMINNNNNNNKRRILSIVLVISSMIFIWISNIYPYDLLVDTSLAAVLLSCFVYAFIYKDNIKKLFYCLLIISLFLTLIKNTGIILVAINCCILLLIAIKNNNFKKDYKYCIIVGISSLFLFYLWSKHVVYGYGYQGLDGRHALSISNISEHLKLLGYDGFIKFLKIYFKNFIDFKNNKATIIIVSINLIMLLMMMFIKKDKTKILKYLFLIDLIYIYYYVALGCMYICSMDQNGLFGLAGFNRYIFTIVGVLVGIFTIVILDEKENFKNSITVNTFIILVVILEGVYIGFINKDTSNLYNMFLGKNNYKESDLYLIDKYLGNKYYNMDNNILYYVYAPTKNDGSGYLYYACRYKFNHGNIAIIDNLSQTYFINNETIVFALEFDDQFKSFAKNNNLCEENERIFKLCKNS